MSRGCPSINNAKDSAEDNFFQTAPEFILYKFSLHRVTGWSTLTHVASSSWKYEMVSVYLELNKDKTVVSAQIYIKKAN